LRKPPRDGSKGRRGLDNFAHQFSLLAIMGADFRCALFQAGPQFLHGRKEFRLRSGEQLLTLADDRIANVLFDEEGAVLLDFQVDHGLASLGRWGRIKSGDGLCQSHGVGGCWYRCRSYPAEFLFDVGHFGAPGFYGNAENSGNNWVHGLVFGSGFRIQSVRKKAGRIRCRFVHQVDGFDRRDPHQRPVCLDFENRREAD